MALVKYGLIDKSQFAFKPGCDIHEPIAATTAYFRDIIVMKAYDKGCFAIYYDISKAYDTMIRWSSTYRSGNAGDRH